MAAVPPVCDFGWKAVDAHLPGVDGKDHSIFETGGPNGLVVAFICNHCPYVKAVIDRIVRDAIELEAHGIGFVAISSNDAGPIRRTPSTTCGCFAERAWLRLPLSLRRGPVGRARLWRRLHARLLRLQRATLTLQYRGRLDASRARSRPGLRRDLFEAMMRWRGPATDRLDQVASIGCSIKWKDAA